MKQRKQILIKNETWAGTCNKVRASNKNLGRETFQSDFEKNLYATALNAWKTVQTKFSNIPND